jgi:hypothetical protein
MTQNTVFGLYTSRSADEGGLPGEEQGVSVCMPDGDVGRGGSSETLADLRKQLTVAEERLSALGEQLRATVNDLAASARDGVEEKT